VSLPRLRNPFRTPPSRSERVSNIANQVICESLSKII